MIFFDILTLFPEIFDSYFNESILKRAQEKKLITIRIHNIRDFAIGRHRTVDDRPYSGGAGMVMKVGPIYRSLQMVQQLKPSATTKSKIILLTPRGKTFNQSIAQEYSKLKRVVLICGHYEGIDERVNEFVDEQVSIGDYVLTGGELPAMIITDAVSRLISKVIKAESLAEETFSIQKEKQDTIQQLSIKRASNEQKLVKVFYEYPQYTRPAVFTFRDANNKLKRRSVPSALRSGSHRKITSWRKKHSSLTIKKW
ncbi:MAG: tRNA (guanosine(37)-N1)-methyltransferase TrmD [Candidatus Aenigmarchaeota archaeon]|nr:tRNA (guanosine(37)-N1)-methyltransferase TrmD [Candidatus Aenigmarchaeota archaeon]